MKAPRVVVAATASPETRQAFDDVNRILAQIYALLDALEKRLTAAGA